METIFIYFLKVNGLLIVFYLAYYFLLQKETFFTTNRWFLLSGLVTAIVLPLLFITKTVLVETMQNPILQTGSKITEKAFSKTSVIDWNLLLTATYFLVSLIFIALIISNLISFFRLLKNKKIEVQKPFLLVEIEEKINPFSFFNYIIYTKNRYSEADLKAILNHEKVHCREYHSFDVMVAKLFCAVFWFNPFVWLYKNAILQNLEFIADQKAIENTNNKKAYQMTLLKVVTDHSYLPITNNFYQPLIKKRIVMLNKNQSQKSNLWKYFLVIPVVVAFIFMFQIKVIAQEKTKDEIASKKSDSPVSVVKYDIRLFEITSKTSDSELKNYEKQSKDNFNVDLLFSKIKRNSKGQIVRISASFNDNKGSKGDNVVESDEAIETFSFSIKKFENGKYEIGFYDKAVDQVVMLNPSDSIAPAIPPLPPPAPPTPPNSSEDLKFQNNEKILYLIDGKKVDYKSFQEKIKGAMIESMNVLKDKQAIAKYGTEGKYGAIEIKTIATETFKEVIEKKETLIKNE